MKKLKKCQKSESDQVLEHYFQTLCMCKTETSRQVTD